jgi:multidrug transporter EmrE-like cation transporter
MLLPFGLLAAICFATGGLFMKHADGVRQLPPALAFLFLFCLGAVLQSYAMRGTGMAVTYVLVLGLEAALALGLSVWLLGESLSPAKLAGVALTIAGVALLRGA